MQLDENDNLVVARILSGGTIDRQGLLHPGDVILEVNSVPVATPEDLQMEVSKSKENVTLRIAPSSENNKTAKHHQVFYTTDLL